MEEKIPFKTLHGKSAFGYLVLIGISVGVNEYFFKDARLYAYGITVLSLIIIRTFHVKGRGYFWVDRYGYGLNMREFFGSWKKGVDGITPLQQTKMSLLGSWMIISGLILGTIVSVILVFFSAWQPNGSIAFIIAKPIWMLLVMLGSLIISMFQIFGLLQKYHVQKKIENTKKEMMQ